jgi:hypothetical protein
MGWLKVMRTRAGGNCCQNAACALSRGGGIVGHRFVSLLRPSETQIALVRDLRMARIDVTDLWHGVIVHVTGSVRACPSLNR